MVKFQVFKNGAIVDKFTLCGAYLNGTDGIAIRRAKIEVKDGTIFCDKPNQEAAALSLLWPIEGFGRVLLPTTCLPERDAPYNLNVEIARAKLMQIINKREDWSFFSDIDDLEHLAKEAQALFVQALQNISNAPMASKLADEALKKAMVFSEQLATKQAEVLFDLRGQNRGFGRVCLGCRIDLKQIGNSKYIQKLLELFGFVTIPVNWGQIEGNKGEYDFSAIDTCTDVLGKKRLIIGAGPLLYFSKEYLPKWLLEEKVSFETVREAAYKFILKLVERYSASVRTWVVIKGINVFNHFGFNFEQVLEITRAANMAVKAVSEKVLKIVEVSNPWGEYYATLPDTIPPLVYVDMVVQSGVNFDAFGLPMCFGKDQDGMHIRDMMHISSILDYFILIAKPLYITEVEVPSQNGRGPYDSKIAGVWHEEWGQTQQQQWIDAFYKIALSKPFVDAVTYSNLTDSNDSAIVSSGLLTKGLEPKKSFQALVKLRDAIFTR